MSDLNRPYSMTLRSISLSPPGTSIVYESIYLIGAFLFHPLVHQLFMKVYI